MTKVSRFWLWAFIFFLGFSGGIVVGVIVDVDTKYETVVKKLKQKNSPGGEIIVDVTTGEPTKTKKELRQERKEERQTERAIRRAARKHN